jgi:hypothetical protein
MEYNSVVFELDELGASRMRTGKIAPSASPPKPSKRTNGKLENCEMSVE